MIINCYYLDYDINICSKDFMNGARLEQCPVSSVIMFVRLVAFCNASRTFSFFSVSLLGEKSVRSKVASSNVLRFKEFSCFDK